MKTKLVFVLLLSLLLSITTYSQLYRSNTGIYKLTKNENSNNTSLIKIRTITDSENSTYIQLSNNQGYFKPNSRFDKILNDNYNEKMYQENKDRINRDKEFYKNTEQIQDRGFYIEVKSARDREFNNNIKSVHDFCEFVKSGGNQ